MEEPLNFLASKRYAVVTGGNKGIGFEICKQLALKGMVVILAARDERRGTDAAEKLRASGLPPRQIVFHQLDVVDSSSIANLANFVKAQFGKLDILPKREIKWNEFVSETYELAEQCIQTNYCGTKKMIEQLLPLLRLSDSARVVNVTSSLGKLKFIPGEQNKAVLCDTEGCLTEESLDELVNEFLNDFKAGSVERKGWPTEHSAYKVSKAATNAYTRLLARKLPEVCINSVCPGFVKTDITCNTGVFTAEEGAAHAVRLALAPHRSPSGLFFYVEEVASFHG
uniref:Uncharacterized protein n=1 Tax=Kalanchoe fedtschenkoi TaxID=63787 RepID=A0A7N0SW36_KALFE